MKILSIDPGYTTGIAVLEDGELESSITVTRKGLYRNGFFNHLVSLSKPDVVVIEALPQNLVSSEMRTLHGFVTNWFKVAGYDVHLVNPGQWKGMVTRVEIPGQHARDAATMGRWWVQSQVGVQHG